VHRTKLIAVLGGGPAGAFASEKLASAGLKTILFDDKLAWEKPCGGALTFKAYNRYPFLIEDDAPKRVVTEIVLSVPRGKAATLRLTKPMLVYSRFDLGRMLLKRAEHAGARIEKARVLEMNRTAGGWRIGTQYGKVDVDFCIVATGAKNALPGVGRRLVDGDTRLALGYYVPVKQAHAEIQFVPELEGYIWVFPRCDHLSVGICGKGESARCLRKSLESYMDRNELPRTDATFFSHPLPCLETASWNVSRTTGEGWIAVGDAAGLVDPITGEGIYYALRSGDLASEVLQKETDCADQVRTYERMLGSDFGANLHFGSGLAKRFFLGRVLLGSVPRRMVQFTGHSRKFSGVMQDLFAGTQPYFSLKPRLLRNLKAIVFETLVSLASDGPLGGGLRGRTEHGS
jgi:flavin-dependent dehydrogenase